jgi:hypothetical protein
MPSSRKATTRISGSWTEVGVLRGLGAVVIVVALAYLAGGWHGMESAGLLAGGPFGTVSYAAQQAVEPDRVAGFMRAKLAHSQDVLEGLSLEDFDLIGKGAQELSLVSQDSSWQVLQTEDYARQSAEFRRSCDTLRKAAQEENLDGALLAWMEVTMKCVQCHRYVRDQDPPRAE